MNLESIDPESAEVALINLGAKSTTLSDAGDDPVLEPAPGETPLWNETKITALFAEDVDIELVRKQLMRALEIDELPRNHDETLADRDWEREWLKDFAPMQFGERLWVCPSGMTVDAPDAIIIELDPGLAFGTGTHQTTALCLQWLEKHDLEQTKVLDLGCGSGILSIAASMLGAASVDAVDIDAQAITATQQNAQRNDVVEQIRVGTSVSEASAPFDIVVANILASTLIDYQRDICKWLKPGGQLVLSGILSGQAEKVAEAYQDEIILKAPVFLDGWARLSGTRHRD